VLGDINSLRVDTATGNAFSKDGAQPKLIAFRDLCRLFGLQSSSQASHSMLTQLDSSLRP